MTVQTRPYWPADQVFILSFPPRFPEFELPEWRLREEIDHTHRVCTEHALQELRSDSAIFIAEDGSGASAAFIHLQTESNYFNGEKYGYISDLAVEKSFESQGIGRMLLETAEDWARSKGYLLLALYVFAGNIRARQIYERYGFEQEVIKYVKKIGRYS